MFQFRFASRKDKVMIWVGIVAAMLGGCSLPVMIVLFGGLADTFVTRDFDTNEVCQYVSKSCCSNNT